MVAIHSKIQLGFQTFTVHVNGREVSQHTAVEGARTWALNYLNRK